MKYELEFKQFEPPQEARSLIEDRVARLERMSQSLPQEALYLRCAVEESPVHTLFRVSLKLVVPLNVLASRGEMHDLTAVIRNEFDEIERQLKAYKSALRREPSWKREEKLGAAPASESPDWFFDLVEPHRKKLAEIVATVLPFLEARGDLPAHELEIDDVVDRALSRAYDDFSKQRTRGDIRSRLVRFAFNGITREVKRAEADRKYLIHIEEDAAPLRPDEQVRQLGDEVLTFFSPEECLCAADVVPEVAVPAPKDRAGADAIRQCVRAAVSALPQDAQRAVTLRYIVGLQGAELAKSMRRTRGEVEELLETARVALRKQLVEAGCISRAGGPAAA